MPRKCPRGFICTDGTTVALVVVLVAAAVIAAMYTMRPQMQKQQPIIVVKQEAQREYQPQPQPQPMFPEPIRRLGIPDFVGRRTLGPIVQVGILTAEGGSANSAAPDRTILPLFGRELDSRRSRWNYYTRTDGTNPVQVPVRVANRVCDDDTNGCNEVYSGDTVHVPVLGRSFTTTIYRTSF
uniref:Uncharacterized protein n=1 Tax=viral metagenome TaxID=1070528 RepID=A0A6C0E5A2_9ZZZZ